MSGRVWVKVQIYGPAEAVKRYERAIFPELEWELDGVEDEALVFTMAGSHWEPGADFWSDSTEYPDLTFRVSESWLSGHEAEYELVGGEVLWCTRGERGAGAESWIEREREARLQEAFED